MTDSTDPSENKFTRLFKDRSIAVAKAKPQLNPMRSPLAAAIAQAAANAAAEDVIDAEVIDAASTIAPAAETAAIAPAAETPVEAPVEVPVETPAETPFETPKAPKVTPPSQLQIQPKTDIPPDRARRRQRGRPSGGKRSDPRWQSRTFYIRKATDIRLERAIAKLKRSGIDLDKSQLADALLNAWAAVELGEFPDFPISHMIERPESDDDD